MKTNEAKKLLDLFADFANADVDQDTKLVRKFLRLHQIAKKFNMLFSVGMEGLGVPGEKLSEEDYCDAVLGVVIDFQESVKHALNEHIKTNKSRVFLQSAMFAYNSSDNSLQTLICDKDDDSLGIKKEHRFSLAFIMVLSMYMANTKGVCRCEVCDKYIIKYTSHNIKTCSATCRQRKRRSNSS